MRKVSSASSSTSSRRERKPQYNYFYGSTEDSSTLQPPNSPLSQMSIETEALIGESLVTTDNEEESATPNTSSGDIRQLVVTNGGGNNHRHHAASANGNEKDPLMVPRNGHSSSSSSSSNKKEKGWWATVFESTLNVDGTYPIGHVTRIIVMVILLVVMCTLIMVLRPSPTLSATGAVTGSTKSPTLTIPFSIVDRANYNDAANEIVDVALFASSLRFNAGIITQGKHQSLRSSTTIDPILRVPFPTGAFWTNFVLKEKPSPDGLSYPIVAYPYAFKWSSSILQASYPVIRRKVDAISIHDVFQPDITFGTKEQLSKRHVEAFDPLSVTIQFYSSGEGFWRAFIVHGSPYITIEYDQVTPTLKALSTFQKVMCPFDQDGNYYDGDLGEDMMDGSPDSDRLLKWGVCSPTEGSGDDGMAKLHGVQFLIQTQENMTWILFASDIIELNFDTRIRTEIFASQKFTGVIRLALIPPTQDYNLHQGNNFSFVPLSVSSGLKRLVYHAGVYPVGGSVSWNFRSSGHQTVVSDIINVNAAVEGDPIISPTTPVDSNKQQRTGIVTFNFETRMLNQHSNSKMQLLMMGLPHHADLLDGGVVLKSAEKFDLEYWCIKGRMLPVIGSTWSYEEKLTSTAFDRDVNVTMDPSVARLIMENVKLDEKLMLPTDNLNVYGYGKQVARLAQLAHIASVTDQQSNQTSSSRVLEDITKKLHESLAALLDGNVKDKLVYDAKFGGIVSSDGLGDKGADFGNGRYNDHHFHYGYVLYAAAVMGNLNSSFIDAYGDEVDSLMYDIAYNGNGDSAAVDSVFFPLTRYMSWYDGHSFAAGLFPFANGKSQESSSEAVNGYYGAYLWSLVKSKAGATTKDSSSDFKDFLRLVLAMEIRGAKTYWHMKPQHTKSSKNSSLRLRLYDAQFAKNYMVGNLGMLDAVCSTYFAKELFYVHLINVLPVTAITAELFNASYAKEQYKNVVAKAEIPPAWKGYAICNQAIADPAAAWKQALLLDSNRLDSGLSKSQALYFISTLNSFKLDSSSIPSMVEDDDEVSSSTMVDAGGAACENHDSCSSLGLSGLCCPTDDGSMLGCCSTGDATPSGDEDNGKEEQSGTNSSETSSTDGQATCDAHKRCADLGLSGLCCPSGDGNMLGCC